MGDVVDFPQLRDLFGRDTGERAEALRRSIRERPILSAIDRELLAKNLFRLLARLEEEKHLRRADLCRAVFNSSKEESTKKLSYFTLNPAKEGAAREKALNALAKKATHYLRLAEQAARMVGEDPDAAVLDLVHGTTLVQNAAVQAEDPLTRDLRAPVFRALDRMTVALARRTDLHRTFRLMARYPTRNRDGWDYGVPEPTDEATAIAAGPVNEVLPLLEDGASTPERADLAKGWLRLALGAPAVLVGESVLHETSRELMPKQLISRPGEERFEPHPGETWSAKIAIRLQVWLGIFPFGPAHEPRPGLRVEIIKHVDLIYEARATDQPFPPLEPLSEGARDRDRRMRQTIERARSLTRQDFVWPRLPVPLGRSPINETLRLSSGQFGSLITVEADLSSINGEVTYLLGRPTSGIADREIRILSLGSNLADQLLGRRDCGTISDWVGPLPDETYDDGIRLPEPPVGYEDEQDEHQRYTQYEEADLRYRFRFSESDLQGKQHERHVQGWSAGTLGYKLERSLLEIEGEDSIASQLEGKARALTERVQRDIGDALRRREERLSHLGRGET